MLKLSNRLQAVAEYVTDGSKVADIGTDHGFLPIYLIQSGKCSSAIAMDVRKGPLERAQEHIKAAGLEGQIQTRLSDGMQELLIGEVDSVTIAGLGGLTMLHILEKGQQLQLLPELKELVLGPQSDIAKVRMFLREHRMYTDKENLVLEDGKFYPILHVVTQPVAMESHCYKNMSSLQKRFQERQIEDTHKLQILDRYGEYLLAKKHPLLRVMLEREEECVLGILQELSASAAIQDKECVKEYKKEDLKKQEKADRAMVRRQEVEGRLADIRMLQEILK